MKFFKATLLALFAAGSALAAPTTEDDVDRVSYDGFKVYRIWTHGRPADVRSKLDAGLASYERWNDDGLYHIDILVSPSEVSAFEALHLEHKILHEDLGASVQSESAGISKRLNVRDDEDWFASYHNYTDHIAYFNELQKRFPDNSEIVSSGESYEGRDIFGIHLYGKAGPGSQPFCTTALSTLANGLPLRSSSTSRCSSSTGTPRMIPSSHPPSTNTTSGSSHS
uniref:Peptidase S53 activation domain-containing protein n=1 Tax=Bionectria ochroleuca TaxID=29856 RepID=A0A8H7KD47_BIOOC